MSIEGSTPVPLSRSPGFRNSEEFQKIQVDALKAGSEKQNSPEKVLDLSKSVGSKRSADTLQSYQDDKSKDSH